MNKCCVIIIQLVEYYVQRVGLLKIIYDTYYSDPKCANNAKKWHIHFTYLMLSRTLVLLRILIIYQVIR